MNTSLRNCISIFSKPAPRQRSHWPTPLLKLKALVGLGEEFATVVEGADVNDRVGARGLAQGRLIDEDDLVDGFPPFKDRRLAVAHGGIIGGGVRTSVEPVRGLDRI